MATASLAWHLRAVPSGWCTTTSWTRSSAGFMYGSRPGSPSRSRFTSTAMIGWPSNWPRSERLEEHTSELQSHSDLVCRLLLEKKNKNQLNSTKHQDITL